MQMSPRNAFGVRYVFDGRLHDRLAQRSPGLRMLLGPSPPGNIRRFIAPSVVGTPAPHAVAPYRASGFVRWHETDMPTALRDVRFQGQSGKHMLASSFSGFDRCCRKSRKSNDAKNLANVDFLDYSAVAMLFSVDTKVRGRFSEKRCDPSRRSEKCRTHASQQASSIQPTRRLERVALACERPHDCVDRVLGNGMAKRDAVFVSGPEMNASPNTRTHHILLCFGQAVPTPRQRSGWKQE